MKNKALAIGEALVVVIETIIVLTAALAVITGTGIGMTVQRIKEIKKGTRNERYIG